MPVSGGNAALLPVEPVGIVLDSRPYFLRRKRNAFGKSFQGPMQIDANQDAADIKDDGVETRRARHIQPLSDLRWVSPCKAAEERERKTLMTAGRMETTTTTAM